MRIVLSVFLLATLAACEPKPVEPAKKTKRSAEPAPWLRVETESDGEVPGSPEQVLVSITTRDGKTWDVAYWQERQRR